MQPIQDWINRKRWDPDFGRGKFILGYYDRIEQSIVLMPFDELWFEPDDHFRF